PADPHFASFSRSETTWKFKMEMLLQREELWIVISDTKPEPVTPQWAQKDARARATIGLCVDDSQVGLVRDTASAKEAWEALKRYHEAGSEVYLLKRLTRLELAEGGDMESHLQMFSNILQQIADLGEPIPRKWQVAMLLCSLPESYDPLTTALEQISTNNLSLDLVKSRLMAEAEKRRERAGAQDNKVFAVAARKYTEQKKKFSGTSVKCFHCGKAGHIKRNCRLLNRSGIPKNDSANVANGETDSGETAGACAWIVNSSGESGNWYIDSGASSHMTSDRDFFETIKNHKNMFVTLADGGKVEIQGIGNGKIVCLNHQGDQTVIDMNDVLYVPKLASSLISVSSLVKKGINVNFDENDCRITNLKGVIAVANKHGNLYKLCCGEKAMVSKIENNNCQRLWHRRLGHRDPQIIKQLFKDNSKLVECGVNNICTSCVEGKMIRSPFKTSGSVSEQILDIVHTDVCGPFPHTPSGFRYFITFIDDHSRMAFVFLIKKKSDVEQVICNFVALCKTQFNKAPKPIRSDNGGEYTGKTLQEFFRKEGIISQLTVPYSPQQNGVAERKNRHLQEMALCMMQDAKMDKKYWGEAVLTATYTQNRLPSRTIGMSPFEKWYGRKPSYDHFRVFGCEAWAQIPKEKRGKLDPKAKRLRFIGYCKQQKAYRLVDTDTDRVVISRDVVFNENAMEQTECVIPANEVVIEIGSNRNEIDIDRGEEEYTVDVQEESYDTAEEDERYSTDDHFSPEVSSKRATRGKPPSKLNDYFLGLVTTSLDEPASYNEAIASEESDKWEEAINDELRSLEMNSTWELTHPPPNSNIIGCKWVFKKKLDANGKVERYKARLVAQGFGQRKGYDYDEVSAPVANQSTLRVLLTVAGHKKLHVKHLDIKTAYLYGVLDETIYMYQPQGFIKPGKEKLVCRLKKSMYGLKQAARVWYQTISGILKEIGFEQCQADTCLFKMKKKNEILYLLIYVDDMIITGTSEQLIKDVVMAIRKTLNVSSLGDINWFLGMRVLRCEDGFYSLKQDSFIRTVASRFGLDDGKRSKFPMDTNYFNNRSKSKVMDSNDEYHKLIGSLLYLATYTRPDIAAVTGILSRCVSNPTQADWVEAKRVVRYLLCTIDYALKLGSPGIQLALVGYCDADWAGDTSDRKSCSGYLYRLGGGTISWTSRKQTCVAMSTMEAEYIALSEAGQQVVWLRRLLKEMDLEPLEATTIFEDNRSFETKYHYTRDLCNKNIIKLRYCASDEMLADILTKPLGAQKMQTLSEGLGLVK
uniref:Retrovirus-related Pol polyprotein from transposon TNT 1-94 n=1 Tax=Anopheles atroparvus TaxID=41427 RepID=A0AAG5DG86_ANOAO